MYNTKRRKCANGGLYCQHVLDKLDSYCLGVFLGLSTSVVGPDMEKASPMSILRLTQPLAQLSVHMLMSVPDLTALRGNPVNVTACQVRPLFCQRLLLNSYGLKQVTALLSTATC